MASSRRLMADNSCSLERSEEEEEKEEKEEEEETGVFVGPLRRDRSPDQLAVLIFRLLNCVGVRSTDICKISVNTRLGYAKVGLHALTCQEYALRVLGEPQNVMSIFDLRDISLRPHRLTVQRLRVNGGKDEMFTPQTSACIQASQPCQGHCQSNCQGHCQSHCQGHSQGHYQSHYQGHCQSHCQGHCQSNCQGYSHNHCQGHSQGRSLSMPQTRHVSTGQREATSPPRSRATEGVKEAPLSPVPAHSPRRETPSPRGESKASSNDRKEPEVQGSNPGQRDTVTGSSSLPPEAPSDSSSTQSLPREFTRLEEEDDSLSADPDCCNRSRCCDAPPETTASCDTRGKGICDVTARLNTSQSRRQEGGESPEPVSDNPGRQAETSGEDNAPGGGPSDQHDLSSGHSDQHHLSSGHSDQHHLSSGHSDQHHLSSGHSDKHDLSSGHSDQHDLSSGHSDPHHLPSGQCEQEGRETATTSRHVDTDQQKSPTVNSHSLPSQDRPPTTSGTQVTAGRDASEPAALKLDAKTSTSTLSPGYSFCLERSFYHRGERVLVPGCVERQSEGGPPFVEYYGSNCYIVHQRRYRERTACSVCAMLNTEGGAIYFGVHPDGRVKGAVVSQRIEDQLRCDIDTMVMMIKPMISPSAYSVNFVKVMGDNGQLVPDLRVLEIVIKKQENQYRLNGNIYVIKEGRVRISRQS
ncbi:midnolin homolog isoform X2 [Aplysia californica]|uniref:Midnolin homolog isoform X2 n=1 Tax=Aplysia californica TaxID=6500 RepID=A0ABM1W3P2_APLCA|nr:midnolin homolog isoform X2 [Aplysia californica]